MARASALAGMFLSELGQPGVLEPNALLPDGIDPDTTKWNAGCSDEYFLLQRGAATVERLPVAWRELMIKSRSAARPGSPIVEAKM